MLFHTYETTIFFTKLVILYYDNFIINFLIIIIIINTNIIYIKLLYIYIYTYVTSLAF